jgi:hypothetical protein
MSKFPSLSSKELIRLLEKGGAVFSVRGQPTMPFIPGWLKVGDIQRRFKPGRKHWILFIANDCSGN